MKDKYYYDVEEFDVDDETPGLVDTMRTMHANEDSRPSPACYGPDPEEIRAPKKTMQCHDFAYEVAEQLGVRVLEGEYFLIYDPETHCYQQVKSLLPYILDVLADSGRKFAVRELGEIENIIRIRKEFRISADALNCNTNRINTQSGVLDWDAFTVSPHNRCDVLTYCVDASFLHGDLDDLSTPTFDAFCQTSLEGDAKKRQLLLEILGYCLSDCTGAKCAFFLKGAPDSGKSVMLEFISRLIPPSAISNIPFHKLHDRFSRAALYGKKINSSGEIKGKSLNEIATFKIITSGDRLEAEFKGKDVFFFIPRCKLIFAGNALPGTSETDATAAFANRLTVLLFNKSIPKEEQNKNLLADLMAERDAIFTKAIHALGDLHRRNYDFDFPEDSLEFLEDFCARHNSVEGFLADCCVMDPESFATNAKFYKAYLAYCDENGLDPYSRNKFYDMVAPTPGVHRKRAYVGGKNLQVHQGLRLVP